MSRKPPQTSLPDALFPQEALTAQSREALSQQLTAAITAARDQLLSQQQPDGHWCYELEADCTIPAEFILMMHFMDEIDEALQQRLVRYLKSIQCAHGGWEIYPGSGFNISCSVKAYYALKLAGESQQSPWMRKACQAILNHGGAARSNVFTRIVLAQFQQVPWRAIPFIPVEMVMLPSWSPFSLEKIAYWSRAVMVPLAILYSLRQLAKNPRRIGVPELFVTPPDQERDYFPIRSPLNRLFLMLERTARQMEPLLPKRLRRHALESAESWMVERLNGEDGLGGIFPAMVGALESLAALGYPDDHPLRITAKQALYKLIVDRDEMSYCQPCLSPVWDTAWACIALQAADEGRVSAPIRQGFDWLKQCQLTGQPGDWQQQRPHLRGGGWAFQYNNPHYPDLDDTAVVAWGMHQADQTGYRRAIHRASQWLAGMQSDNGGYASFEVNNTHLYLNEIPFADHGALLDPPTADVTARCVMLFTTQQDHACKKALQRALAYLSQEQEPSGAWFGRWGTNYIYGTWSVLQALEALDGRPVESMRRRAAAWLKQVQRDDGGWGESNDSYFFPDQAGRDGLSTAYQTAWAMLGLIAAGETDGPTLQRGALYLINSQRTPGQWQDPTYNAPGFPRIFHLNYYGYNRYFPLWALSRYASLLRAGKSA